MGEAGKNQGDKKSDKKDDGAGTGAIVLKLDMHCVGCLKKVKKFVRGIDGVTEVKPDLGRNMLTVVGKVDPVKIRDQVAEKTKKKVDIISPQPKKDGGDKKKAEDDKKQPPKEPQVSTVVYKMKLHCDGCVQKLRKLATKYKGVEEVKVDNQKELVAVKGTMDVKALTPYLTKNLKRDVEVVPPKKDDAAGGDKKGKEGGGGDKKGKEGGGKVEHYPSSPFPFPPVGYGHGYDPMQMQMMMQAQAQAQAQAYQAQQYYYHPGYPAPHFQAHAPQMFSDENPNACSVM